MITETEQTVNSEITIQFRSQYIKILLSQEPRILDILSFSTFLCSVLYRSNTTTFTIGWWECFPFPGYDCLFLVWARGH